MKYFLLTGGLILVLLFQISCDGNNSSPGGSGLVETTEVVVSAKASGSLKMLNVDEGDIISMSERIGVIDTTTILLQIDRISALKKAAENSLNIAAINIKQAGLNFSLAEKEFDRAKTLIKSGTINQQQFDRTETAFNQSELSRKQSQAAYNAAEADIQRLKAELALLNQQYNDCFPAAPRSGVVSDKYVEVGELINIGTPLIKIAGIDTVSVKIYLPASDLTKIKIGDKAQIDPEDDSGRELSGHIIWISPEAEFTPKNVQTKEARANLVYAVKISIPNPEQILKIGMPVSVKIL